MALTVTMTGSGSLGGVLPGWSITEQATPSMPGDSRGSVGSASFRAHAKSDSRFAADNACLLETSNGSMLGRVNEVAVDALRADVSVAGPLQFLSVDKTLPPIWFTDANDFQAGAPGAGTGQVARAGQIAVDPVDGGVWITSYSSYSGTERHRAIKFDSAGNYVTEVGTVGSGNGQFASGFGFSAAVSPVDQSLWIGDSGNYRLQKFTTADGGLTYSYSTKVGAVGSGNGQFGATFPIALAIDASGNVYAGDRGNARIQKFNSSATYQAQVAVTSGTIASPWALAYDPVAARLYASISLNLDVLENPGTIASYNTSLVLQGTVTIAAPSGTEIGIGNIAVDPDGNIWAQWFRATYLVKYSPAGAELARWQSLFPAPQDSSTYFSVAAGTNGTYALYKQTSAEIKYAPDYFAVGFDYSPVLLSAAIEQYMEACDLTLNGWTLDYQGAVDPEVVFPGWAGNVWANLKEIAATLGVELNYTASTQTIIVRDTGSATTTFTNIEPATTRPVNLTGGRVVDVIYQQPRAGGGVVWDAATENQSVSIKTGETVTRVFSTDNHPAELAQPVPTDTLPIQPGQYYVVDNAGLPVPAATWLAAGGNITLTVGSSPGTISAFIQGPASNPSGFTGPYSFATGNEPDDTPALSIVGNGTFCTPTLFARAGSQGQPFNSPFMDTVERIAARGHYPSLQDPNVVLNFIIPTADLPPVGQACGVIFPYEDSRYRILEVSRGNLKSTITAERWVTIEDIDTLWVGQTIGDFDTAWSGYSLGDIQVQPLRTA